MELPVKSFKESQKAKEGKGYKAAPPEYELYDDGEDKDSKD